MTLMHSTTWRCRQFRAAAPAAAALLAALAAPASADIVAATFTSNTLFNYRVHHMPDLDQVRSSLPCDGVIHCVPTCASNMVMYAANHGFPGVVPGPGYWEGNANYVAASNTIFLLGVNMQTSCADNGTDGGNANEGLETWLAFEPGLIVNDHLSLGSFSPNHTSIGKSLCAGRIGSVSFGRYDVVGSIDGIPVVDRDGGHCTTAVKVRRNGATRELWVRDPASDENDDTSQSPFFNDIWSLTELTVVKVPGMNMQTVTAINYTPGANVIRIIDGHRTLTPAQGYYWDSSLGAVALLGPQNFMNPTAPTHQTFPAPGGLPVISLAWQDLSHELLATVASEVGPSLFAFDPLTSAVQHVPTTIAPALIATGRSDNLYLCNGSQLTMMLRPAPTPPPAGPPTVLALPHIAHAMTFDDARDRVVMVSRTDRKLMSVDKDLAGPVLVQNIPTMVPMNSFVQIALDPTDVVATYILIDSFPQVWKLTGGTNLTATPIMHPSIAQAQSLDFNRLGQMLVSNNGSLVVLDDGSAGWAPVPDSPFAGLAAGRHFRMMRGRTNFTEGVHDTPGWTTNIDPAQLAANPQAADCPADIAPHLNADDLVNVSDLLAVISAWGPCQFDYACPADIAPSAGDDMVNVADLLRVISSWGPCP